MSEESGEREAAEARTSLSRRRLLAGASAGLGGAFAIGSTATGARVLGSGSSSRATAQSAPANPLDESPGSQFAPHDGFATMDWFPDSVDVYTVTNLDNSGDGSLRWAVEQSGPRVVVFEVSGTIDLEENRLTISDDECWVAGQTAPSPGITLIRDDLEVNADNCVVQHLRVRPGDADNGEGWEPDGIKTADDTSNNVIDHCSISWSVDENATAGWQAVDTTFSNCLIAEPLNDATHEKDAHGYGMLVGDNSTRNAIVGNLFAHNVQRNPRLKDGTTGVIVNNVIYDFEEGTNGGSTGTFSIEGNGYVRSSNDALIRSGGSPNIDAYIADNFATYDTNMTNGFFDRQDSRPIWPSTLSTVHPGNVRQHNTVHVGARPADRSEHDQRIVNNFRNGEGSVIDSQDEVGGYPSLDENSRSLDVPDSGLGDWLYEFTREVELDVTDYATDGVVSNAQVRTALDDWRNHELDTPLLRDVIDSSSW